MLAPSRYTILKLIQVLCTLISNLDLLDLEFQQLKLERSRRQRKKERLEAEERREQRGGEEMASVILLF